MLFVLTIRIFDMIQPFHIEILHKVDINLPIRKEILTQWLCKRIQKPRNQTISQLFLEKTRDVQGVYRVKRGIEPIKKP